jgi:hypothetical protein
VFDRAAAGSDLTGSGLADRSVRYAARGFVECASGRSGEDFAGRREFLGASAYDDPSVWYPLCGNAEPRRDFAARRRGTPMRAGALRESGPGAGLAGERKGPDASLRALIALARDAAAADDDSD